MNDKEEQTEIFFLRRWNLDLLLFGLVWLAGCTTAPMQTSATTTSSPTHTETTATSTATPIPTSTESPTATSPPTREPLPSDPQIIEFEAEDGAKLTGAYFPAASDPAPLIVLMHWAQGDQSDWREAAVWLQNRVDFDAEMPLPDIPGETSFAVFTFNLRGFGLSAGPTILIWDPDGWIKDVSAAMDTARGLPGVDPDRYLTIGASIGADAAVLACGSGCRGALSISPGGSLNLPYPEAVEQARARSPQGIFWCLAAEGDQPSAQACQAASGEGYSQAIYPGQAHGMDLFQPENDPDFGQIMLDFVNSSLGEGSDP